jgi:nucleotidyltransferase substrate binding protein (TIGR01987 family)
VVHKCNELYDDNYMHEMTSGAMSSQDVRWIQRFNHFIKAFAQLKDAIELSRQRKLSKLEEQGLIQAFEYTHEIAWNTLKDFLEERGTKKMYGSKDATREAFKAGLIENGEVWMDMIESRNLTSHTYNEEIAAAVVSAIINSYFDEFSAFYARMQKLKEEQV